MKFKRRSAEPLAVNLTPLIDVVFLLLIFFMVSTSFTQKQSLSVNLPHANNTETKAEPKQLIITVGKDGHYAVNGKVLIDTAPKTLKLSIMELSDNDASLPVMISADEKAPWQSVITVMDIAGQLGMLNLGMLTKTSTN